MKFADAEEIISRAATIRAYVREAIAIEKAGLRVEKKKTEDFPVPEELKAKFQSDPQWIAARAKTEEDGQIVGNIVSQLLVPTPFSSVR